MKAVSISLVAHPEPELLSMRGIASRFVVSSLLSSKPELGKPSKTTLLAFALVWILTSWDCRGLHTSNTPVSSTIRMASTTSTLTRTYCCHPCASTLVVTRKRNQMFFLYRNKFCYQLVKDLATWTARECSVNRQSWNYNRNIHWTLRSGLLRYTRLGIGFKVRSMVQRLIGILKLGLGLVNLKGMTSVFLQSERSEPTTWEVTSTQVQKHTLGAEGVLPRE